jgi:hypothetical protein
MQLPQKLFIFFLYVLFNYSSTMASLDWNKYFLAKCIRSLHKLYCNYVFSKLTCVDWNMQKQQSTLVHKVTNNIICFLFQRQWKYNFHLTHYIISAISIPCMSMYIIISSLREAKKDKGYSQTSTAVAGYCIVHIVLNSEFDEGKGL